MRRTTKDEPGWVLNNDPRDLDISDKHILNDVRTILLNYIGPNH